MTLPSSRTNIVDRFIERFAAHFGDKAKEVERFIRFSIVGALGAVVDFSTLNILQSSLLPPVDPYHNLKIATATGIAFCAAVMSNFIWNRYWTYPDSRSKSLRRQLVMFYSVNTAALFFRLIFVSATFLLFADLGEGILLSLGILDTALGIQSYNQLGTNIAQAIAVVLAMFWNFAVNRLWTYNDVSSLDAQ
ncbi:MAG: GtrA family protein [Anaerolineales bacterium]